MPKGISRKSGGKATSGASTPQKKGGEKKPIGEKKQAGGRRPAILAPGWGQALYEAIIRQRHPDGNAWGLTDFAEKMGVSQNTVTRWLKLREPPSRTVLLGSAKTLGVEPESLRYGVGDEIYLINLPTWMKDAIMKASPATASGKGTVDPHLRDSRLERESRQQSEKRSPRQTDQGAG